MPLFSQAWVHDDGSRALSPLLPLLLLSCSRDENRDDEDVDDDVDDDDGDSNGVGVVIGVGVSDGDSVDDKIDFSVQNNRLDAAETLSISRSKKLRALR